jgi:hypothetical protein
MPAALAIVAIVTASGLFAQDSRPASAPASRPAALKPGDLFNPEVVDPAAKNLVSVARAYLALDWFTQKNEGRKKNNALTPDATELRNLGIRLEGDVRRHEVDDRMRNLVIEYGMSARDGGARVLPLGRFAWQKPESAPGRQAEWSSVLGAVIAAELPLGAVKGFDLKGEFLDAGGKVLATIDKRSVDVVRRNGLFVIAVPAKAVLGDTRLLDGFRFRLIDLKAVK